MIFREFFPRRPAADPRSDRERMLERDLKARGIRDPRVLAAMAAVPRELFVPREFRDEAYADRALPIGRGQTISQPYIVALMVEALALRGRETVLEVGLGSGYASAVLAQIASWVVGIERLPELAELARSRFAALGLGHCEVVVGDGRTGWPAEAPYDAILVSAAAEITPPTLVEQLAEGGRLVIPLGPEDGTQILTAFTRRGRDLRPQTLCPCRFVPLVPGLAGPEN
jgi:protein-L-isoaspartate(D-aspartate) O-methyltransferase